MAQIYWNSKSTADWSSNSSWLGGVAPSAIDDVFFVNPGAFFGSLTVLSNVGVVGSLTVGANMQLNFASGGAVVVSGNLTVAYTGGVGLIGGAGGSSLSIGGTYANSGSLTIGGGATDAVSASVTAGRFVNSGAISLDGGSSAAASLNILSDAGLGVAGVISGSVTLSHNARLSFASGQIFSIDATGNLALSGAAAYVASNGDYSGNSALMQLSSVAGRLSIAGGGNIAITGDLVNTGSIGVDTYGSTLGGSNFSVRGTFSNSGVFIDGLTTQAAASLASFGALSNSGAIYISGAAGAPGTITIGGASVNTGAITVNANGVLNISATGGLNVASGATGYGVVSGAGAFFNAGAVTLQSDAKAAGTAAPTLATTSILNDGTILARNGYSLLGVAGGTILGSGAVAIGSGGALEIRSAIAGNRIEFLPNGGAQTLLIDDVANFNAQISGFAFGDTLEFNQQGFSPLVSSRSSYSVSYDAATQTSTLAISAAGSTATRTLTLAGDYSGVKFLFSTDKKNAAFVDVIPYVALLQVDIATATANALAGKGYDAGALVSVVDTAANIASITRVQADALKSAGFASIAASSYASVTLTLEQAQFLVDDGIAITGASLVATASGSALLALSATRLAGLKAAQFNSFGLVDTAAAIAALTPAQIAALAAEGVTSAAATDGPLTLGIAALSAFSSKYIAVRSPVGAPVSVADTAANIAAIGWTQGYALAFERVTTLASTTGAVTLNLATANVLNAYAIGVTGASVVVSDSAAAWLGSASGLGPSLGAYGYRLTLLDTAADIAALTPARIAALQADGVASVAATDGPVTLAIAAGAAWAQTGVNPRGADGGLALLADSAANIAALTKPQADALSAAGYGGIVSLDATVTLNASTAQLLAADGLKISAASTILADTATTLQGLSGATIAALAGAGVKTLYATDSSLSFTPGQTAAILANGLSASAAGAGAVTENFANGAYSTYANGALLQQKSVNGDGSFSIDYAQITGRAYGAYEEIYDTKGAKSATAYDNFTGAGSLTLSGSGLKVTEGANQFSAAIGADTFAFTPHSSESISASGSASDVFIFAPGFGQTSIAGFAAAGAAHDTLEFYVSDFTYLSAKMSQSQLVNALLSHASQSAGGTTFTDSFGDSLTLAGVSKSTLALNAADFKFV